MTNSEKIRLCGEIVNEIQENNKRPKCGLNFAERPFAVTDSHIGGVPYLPRDKAYPVGKSGQNLWLCAQINFEQMPRIEGFPTEGILQFYLSDFDFDGGFGIYSENDPTIQGEWRVLYFQKPDNTVTKEECLAKMPGAWEEKGELWRVPYKPLKMLFLPVERDIMDHEDYRFDVLFDAALKARLPDADPKEFMPYKLRDETPEERGAMRIIRDRIKCGGCKMGGYPRYYQDDPRLYDKETGKPLKEWDTLLFQLDDDTYEFPAGELGDMNFSLNGGTLNFLIRFEDLKKRDFSQVLAQWACT